MVEVMATDEKVRLVLVVSSETRDALRLEAAVQGEDMSPLAERILQHAMPNSLETVRKRRQVQDRKRKPPTD